MTVDLKNGKLIITIDTIDPPRPSASGKSLVVASTNGNVATEVIVDGRPLVIGLNAYIRNN